MVTVIWSYAYTNWELQRDEGYHISAYDHAPLNAWRTPEEAKAAAEAEHRRDFDEFAAEDPIGAEDMPFKPLEWEAVRQDRHGDGRMDDVFFAGEADIDQWVVYPIEIVEP